jgi:regulator-associated protein of mTOR
MWSDTGEPVGSIRSQTSLLSGKGSGPVTCLAFHPYQLLLAVGGREATASVHVIDGGSGGQLSSRSSLA